MLALGTLGTDEIKAVLQDLQAACVQASGQLIGLGLEVTGIGVDLRTTLDRTASGELDLKLVKLGGGVSTQAVSTISVDLEPADIASAGHIADELSDALVVIQEALAAVSTDFVVKESKVELAFTTALDGSVSVVIGGKVSHAETHIARIALAPRD